MTELGVRDKLPLPAPETHRNSPTRAAAYVRQLILDGVLRPGARVPQDEVAAALGVSRNPVREGLIMLDREGWVTMEPNRGAFVNTSDAASILDHFELCAFVHALALRRAMQEGRTDVIERLDAIEHAFAATSDPVEAHRLAIKFSSVVIAAGSPAAFRANSNLHPWNFFEYLPSAIAIEKEGQAAIIRAAKHRDADAVAVAYAEMMRKIAECVIELYRERGLFGDSEVYAA